MKPWLLLAALAGCAHATPDRKCSNVRPVCLAVMKCQTGDDGCERCLCDDGYIPANRQPPPGQPPFQR